MLIFFALVLIALSVIIFILAPMPGRIAKKRNHPQAKIIRTSGWVAVLSSSPSAWILALQWAYGDTEGSEEDLEQEMKALVKKDRRWRNLSSPNLYGK